MQTTRSIASLVVGWLILVAGAAFASEAPRIGRTVETFQLNDYQGNPHSLDDYRESKLVVLAFMGTECPLATIYAPRLSELAAEYAPQGVQFLAINSNRQDSTTKLSHYARTYGLTLPLLKDLGNALADQVGAERTPEVFVLDADRKVRYAGRIDDQYGVGYQRGEATRRDLAAALDELLAGSEVSVAETKAPGCLIGRVREANEQAHVTYSTQIARIFQAHCVECHRDGQIAPFPLTSYDEVVGWAEMIDEVVSEQRMPPWHASPEYGHFSNDIRLSDQELADIHAWVEAGAPEGNPAELPPPREFVEGWQLPRDPDQVVYISDEPYDVAADGVVEYQYFEVDPGFTEDKWVKVAECVPDNRRVVHHIIVFVRPPAGQQADVRGFNFLVGYAPGTRPFVCPDGMAKLVPAGSKLVFQMHYTPIGTPQKDRSYVGLVFVDDPSEIKHRVATAGATNAFFQIPPHAENHRVMSTKRFVTGGKLLSLFPHMHLRGKSFRYELERPDGTKEILLDVPRYDFNWQNSFIFSEPIEIEPKSRLICTAHFDNSANNLANPNPDVAVRWGDQTWEEMMIGWHDIALPIDASPAEDAEPSAITNEASGGE